LLTASAASPGTGIEAAYYVIASVIAIGGIAIGGAKLLLWLRGRWTREGQQRAESSRVIEENTVAAKANTEAIADLSGKLEGFAAGVRSDLNGHEQRITRLELDRGSGRAGSNHGAD